VQFSRTTVLQNYSTPELQYSRTTVL
jgi:hypothetical protein